MHRIPPSDFLYKTVHHEMFKYACYLTMIINNYTEFLVYSKYFYQEE